MNVENLLLRTRLLRPVWPTTDVIVTTDLHCEAKKHHFYFLNNFVKSRSILIIFGTQDTWMNLQRMVIKLSTSPNECHYTTLWNTTCVNLFITTVMEALNVRHDKLTVTDKHITTSVCLWLFLTRAFSVSSGNFAECLCMMRPTDLCKMPVSLAIWRVVSCVPGAPSWLSAKSLTVSMLSAVRDVRGVPLPGCQSVVPVSHSF